jgi:hypothetical protein
MRSYQGPTGRAVVLGRRALSEFRAEPVRLPPFPLVVLIPSILESPFGSPPTWLTLIRLSKKIE